MSAFVLRRLTWGLGVVLLVGICGFLLTFIVPTDPAKVIAGHNASAENVQRIRESLGLDRPALDQLADYLGGLFTGDLGISYGHGGMPVLDIILARMPATIQLAVVGLGLALLVGVPLGVWSAQRRGGVLDRGVTVVGSAFLAIPGFLLGFLLIYLLAFLPLEAADVVLFPLPGTNVPWDPFDLHALALPAITLGLVIAPFYARITRTLMLEELHREHVRTARAKGLHERQVIWRHAFRNAAPTIATQVGMDLGFLLGGVFVIEYVFSWPGIGQQALSSVTGEDLPVLMGTLMLGAFLIVLSNIVADVVAALLDPRMDRSAAGS